MRKDRKMVDGLVKGHNFVVSHANRKGISKYDKWKVLGSRQEPDTGTLSLLCSALSSTVLTYLELFRSYKDQMKYLN